MYENPYSVGRSDAPDNATAITYDGGLLCYRCVTDPTLPVVDHEHMDSTPPDDPSDEQWAVIGFDQAGSYGDTPCAHCNGPT